MKKAKVLNILAFLNNTENFNVISVDWSEYSRKAYPEAVTYVESVGLKVSQMINFLHAKGLNCSKLTLVGHSLGAHVMGLAGKSTTKSCQVAHVVGR